MDVNIRPTTLMTKRLLFSPPGTADTIRIEPNYANEEGPNIQLIDISDAKVEAWLFGLRDEGQLDIDDGTWGLGKMGKAELNVKAEDNGLEWTRTYLNKTKIADLRMELKDHILTSSGEESNTVVDSA